MSWNQPIIISNSWEDKIALTSSDCVVFDVEEAVVLESRALVDFIEKNSVSKSSLIKIHDVNSESLAKIIDYCRRQAKGPDILDATQLLNVDPTSLFHLIHASHKLKIYSLKDLACKTFSDMFTKRIKKRIEGSAPELERSHCMSSGKEFDSRVGDRPRRLKLGSSSSSVNDVIPNNIAIYLRFNTKRKVNDIRDCVAKILLEDKESQRIGVIELCKLITVDPRMNGADYVTSEAVRRLIKFLSPENHWGFRYYAAMILAHLKNWRDVPKKDAVIPLKELISSKDKKLLAEGLNALALVASDPSTKQAILDSDLLESVAKIFSGNKVQNYRLGRHAAKFLSAFCCNALSQEKKEACVGIIRNLFKCVPSEEVMTPACCALFNLTKEETNVTVENNVVEKLVSLISIPNPYIVFPALEVLGNIVRWGNVQQIEVMVDNNIVLHLECFLRSKNKIVQKEACWIISNITAKISKGIKESSIECLCYILENGESDVHMEAAWAIFNWFINDTDSKEIIWPRRRGEAFSVIQVGERCSYTEYHCD